jgi:MFS family permease
MLDDGDSLTKWYILALLTATSTFVTAIPFSCLPALFKEISEELNLTLVQIGTIWGLSSLAGLFVSIISGVLSDRFKAKFILTVLCILGGITGGIRGLSGGFLSLAITVFISGITRMMLPVNITKAVCIWFKGPKLGTAIGISAMGMGLGLMLGPMISATILSPLLGGWRNVLYLYGAISVFIGFIWFMFGKDPQRVDPITEIPDAIPLRQSFSSLIRLKALWLIGLMLLFRIACIMGVTGYIPLYLRGQGWPAAEADGTLSAFYAISTVCVIPLAFISDRLGSRKAILFPSLIVAIVCVTLLPFVDSVTVWVLMILTGIFMDGFMAITVTMLLETEGVGTAYSGTAMGIMLTIAQVGSVISPPIGNSFADIAPGAPFIFWAALSVVSLIVLFFIRETGRKKTIAVEN